MKIKKTKKSKLKNWIFKNFTQKYLFSLGMDSHLVSLFTEPAPIKKLNNFEEERIKNAKRIIKKMKTKKYKEFFYRAIRYQRSKPKLKPIKINWLDKIVSKLYFFLFDRKLNKTIKKYFKFVKDLKVNEAKINNYMANTSFSERNERALKLGIIDKERFLELDLKKQR